jgi:GR25 family glycosyltransferase involved in LPS biosynthesis
MNKLPIKSFIITMLGHELSEQLSAQCREQAAKFGVKVEIFEAIWGKDYQHHLAHLNIHLGRQKLSKMTLGHYGNFLSHFYLWMACIKDQQPYLVLEHDGWLMREIPHNILDQFDDVCKLDCLSPYMKTDGGYDALIEQNINDAVTVVPLQSIAELTKYPDALRFKKRAGCYSSGVYAYIIKPQGARKLINYVKEHGFLATDNQVNTNVMDVRVCIPSVARLHPVMKSREIIGQMSTSRHSPNPHTGEGIEHAEQE